MIVPIEDTAAYGMLSTKLSDVVREAMHSGWSPKDLVRCVKECWIEELRDQMKQAEKSSEWNLQ